jgi:hypothetical protein
VHQLFAGDVHVTVNSQRFTQGEIGKFAIEFTRSNVALSLKLEVLNNNDVIALARWKQAHKNKRRI